MTGEIFSACKVYCLLLANINEYYRYSDLCIIYFNFYHYYSQQNYTIDKTFQTEWINAAYVQASEERISKCVLLLLLLVPAGTRPQATN